MIVNRPARIRTTIEVPSDKSISHRSFIFNAIADGMATVTNPLDSEDVRSTVACLRALGVQIEGPHTEDQFLLDTLPESGAKYGMLDARTVTPDRWLKEGDQVTVGGLNFAIYEAPGHTPGSVVFFNDENRFALVGDVLFQGSVGRTDVPRGSHETLMRSIRDKLLPLGDDVVFLPGHGSPGQIGDERQNNPFLNE